MHGHHAHFIEDNFMKVVSNGRLRDAEDVQLAEKIIELKNTKDHWAVIDLLVKVWAKKSPDEVKAQKVVIQGYKNSLTDKKFGQTSGGKDFERRFILSFPQNLRMMIGAVFKNDLVIDSKFFAEFGRRYPFFMVPEKL